MRRDLDPVQGHMGNQKGKRKRQHSEAEQDDSAGQAGEEMIAGPNEDFEDGVADFGFEEDAVPSGGRRQKTLREKRKKAKPGTFGVAQPHALI